MGIFELLNWTGRELGPLVRPSAQCQKKAIELESETGAKAIARENKEDERRERIQKKCLCNIRVHSRVSTLGQQRGQCDQGKKPYPDSAVMATRALTLEFTCRLFWSRQCIEKIPVLGMPGYRTARSDAARWCLTRVLPGFLHWIEVPFLIGFSGSSASQASCACIAAWCAPQKSVTWCVNSFLYKKRSSSICKRMQQKITLSPLCISYHSPMYIHTYSCLKPRAIILKLT